MCVDLPFNNINDGVELWLWDCNLTPAQFFRVEPTGGGYVRIRKPDTNTCWDVLGASSASGAAVGLWGCVADPNQQFLWDMAAGTFTASHSGMCVDVTGSGYQSSIQQTTCSGSSTQSLRVVNHLQGTWHCYTTLGLFPLTAALRLTLKLTQVQ